MKQVLHVQVTLYTIAVLLGTVYLCTQAYSVRRISHDDAISYLAATGHQGQYQASKPGQRWTYASQWQDFWTPDKFWCFTKIARDLATTDIHPPMYFWSLHVWSMLYGVTLATGPLLNIPFHILACLTITAVCRFLGCAPWIAGATGLLWLFCGANLYVVAEARPYSLLAAVSVIYVLSILCFLRRPSISTSSFVCLTSTVGMLTHYHFILLLAVCGGMAAFQLLFERRYFELFMFASSIVLAGLFFVVVHPTFFLSFQRQVLQSQVFDWVEIPARLRLVLHTMLEVFIPHRIVSPLVINASHFCLLVLTVVLTGMAVFLYHAKGLNLGGLARKLIRPKSIPFVASITCFLFIVLLYVSFRSPRHAMGAKYLMIVTPLFFIALGQIIAALNSIRHTMAVVIVVVLLISQITYGTMVTVQSLERVWQPHVNPLRGRDAILVLDSTARGVLPTVLWHADPELSVFASEQKFLLADGFPVLPAHRVVLYVSDIRYQNSKTGREALLHTFSNLGYEVSKLSETYFFHYSEAYVMVP